MARADLLTKEHNQKKAVTVSDLQELNRATESTTDREFASRSKKMLAIEDLAFHQGGHVMANTKVALPKGSIKLVKQGYEQVNVPAEKVSVEGLERISISELPEWARKAFQPHVASLNPI